MVMECPEDHNDEFCPSNDRRLIDGYLRPKIAGKNVSSAYVHDADVCLDHPYDLVRGHTPAPGTGDGDGRAWFFFSPERYVGGGGGKTSARGGGSRPGHRARAVVGADGKKKGTWHAEGKKEAVAGSGGGYCRSLTYHEMTPSGSFVKPGWLMVEYGVDDEDGGGGGVVLCKVYKSRRGPGSNVPSRKRKADVEAPSASSFLSRQRRTHHDDDAMSCNKAAPQRQETELVRYQGTEQVHGGDPHPGDADAFTMLRAFMETDEDENALQLPANFDPVKYLLGEHQPGPGNTILEELMGSSAPVQCSATPSSLLFDND
uniref:NAC domain-containing protein n=1 Tax=Setaria italica TaxID=4555 RepID=K4AJ64_SETIT